MFSGNIFVQIWYKFICNLNKDLCYLSEICGSLFLVVFESPATFLVGIWESVSDSQMGFSSSDLIERQAGSVWVEGDEEEAPAWWESGDLLSGRGPGNLTSKSEHRRDLTVVSLHSHLYERRRKKFSLSDETWHGHLRQSNVTCWARGNMHLSTEMQTVRIFD